MRADGFGSSCFGFWDLGVVLAMKRVSGVFSGIGILERGSTQGKDWNLYARLNDRNEVGGSYEEGDVRP